MLATSFPLFWSNYSGFVLFVYFPTYCFDALAYPLIAYLLTHFIGKSQFLVISIKFPLAEARLLSERIISLAFDVISHVLETGRVWTLYFNSWFWNDYAFPSFLSEMETQLKANMIGSGWGLNWTLLLMLNRGGDWFLRTFQHWYTLGYFHHL